MGKKFITAIFAAAALCALLGITAFAGEWKRDQYGWWYQVDSTHYYASGIQLIDGEYYMFDQYGYMITGWKQTTGDDWYYAYPSGAMARNAWIDGYYYVGDDGRMLSDTWIGEYYVDKTGRWVPGKVKGSTEFAKNWIFGEYQNTTEAGYKKGTHYKELKIYYNPAVPDYYAEFGLYDIAGTGRSLYDKSDPSGDLFTVGLSATSHYSVYSLITEDFYSLDYDGYDTITLHWKNTSWTNKDITFKKIADYGTEYRNQSGSGSSYTGGVG